MTQHHSKPQLVVLGEDWGQHPSSTQHLIKRLLPDYQVLWVNSIGLRRPRFKPARHHPHRAQAGRRGAARRPRQSTRPKPEPGPASGASSTDARDTAAAGAATARQSACRQDQWPLAGRPDPPALTQTGSSAAVDLLAKRGGPDWQTG